MQVELPDKNQISNFTNLTADYTGFSMKSFSENLLPDYWKDYTRAGNPPVDFATVFAVLFSGVTGIMIGANIAGMVAFFLIPILKPMIYYSKLIAFFIPNTTT